MRAIIVFLALCAGFLVLSCASADAFQTLNAATVVDTNEDTFIDSAVQDEDFLYYVTLFSPVKVGKLNKTQLATPGWNGASVSQLNVSSADTVAFSLLYKDSNSIFLQGQSTTYLLSSTNLALLNTRVGEEINSLTGFISEDSNGTSVVNLFGYAVQRALQIRLDDPSMNDTAVFDIPFTDTQASSYYHPNDIAILADFSSTYAVYKWSTKDLLLTFKIRDQSTGFIVYDGATNVLYTCGDRSYAFAVLTRVNLSNIQNNTEISFSISLDTPYYSSEAVIAQAIGEESTCRGLALHPSGQLLYALYDPPSSSGQIGRAIASTLDTVETTSVDASVSQKTMSLLLETDQPLIYVFTETDVAVVKFPTTYDCPRECSNHGYCNSTTNYLCVCDEPYFGHNCEQKPTPIPPVEQPLYEPIRLLGQLDINPNIGSVADDEYIYYFTNCSIRIGKVRKGDIISSTKSPSVFNETVVEDFGVAISLIDTQLGLIYFIGETNCQSNWDPNHQAKLIRVSTSNFTDHTVMDLSKGIATAFVSNDTQGSTYLNMFGWMTSLRLKSSKSDNPLQSFPTMPADALPIASTFLPQSNTAIIVTEYPTLHYSFNTGNITHSYTLPSDFTAKSLAADEERGKLYIVGTTSTDNWYLLVLTPELLPYGTKLTMNGSDQILEAIFISTGYWISPVGLFLDLEAGQAIIGLNQKIIRLNLLTHEVFDTADLYYQYGLSLWGAHYHYEVDTRLLFITGSNGTQAVAVAFYIPMPCPRNCSGNGQCVYGACQCDDGFTGENCDEIVVPPVAEEPVEEPVVAPNAAIPIANIASTASLMTPLLGSIAIILVIVSVTVA